MSGDEYFVRVPVGDDLDGEGLVTIHHDKARSEVIIYVGGAVVVAVDALGFFAAVGKSI